MEPINICLCGAQSGYPHDIDCPRPLYRATVRQEKDWEHERAERLKTKIAAWEAREDARGGVPYEPEDSWRSSDVVGGL
jgi:hypothetical protein